MSEIRAAFLKRVTGNSNCRTTLDIVYHAELGLDEHIDAIYHENEMDLQLGSALAESDATGTSLETGTDEQGHSQDNEPEAIVLFERGTIEQRIVHDEDRIEQRRVEREREAFAQRYAQYVQTTAKPVSFEQYVTILRMMGE